VATIEAGPGNGDAGRWWGQVDYLLWWIKGDSLPPLLTTSPTGTTAATAGVPGRDRTTLLFGNETVNGGDRSGARLTLGYWFDQGHTFGIDASYFIVEGRGSSFAADSTTNPILARPFFNTSTAFGPSAALISFPNLATGSVFISEHSSQFHGGELLLRESGSTGWARLDVLFGYRYLHLADELDIGENVLRLAGRTTVLPLATLPRGASLMVTDRFRTANDFDALEVGLDGEARWGNLVLTGFAKIAAGRAEESVDIVGTTTRTLASGSSTTRLGGFLALPTNGAKFSKLEYPVVPDIGLGVGYQVTPRLRASVGYELLYWSRVLRPGPQVESALNPGLLPLSTTAVTGIIAPRQGFEFSDLLVQGLNVGVEFRY
jgi:hypothetical protein